LKGTIQINPRQVPPRQEWHGLKVEAQFIAPVRN